MDKRTDIEKRADEEAASGTLDEFLISQVMDFGDSVRLSPQASRNQMVSVTISHLEAIALLREGTTEWALSIENR